MRESASRALSIPVAFRAASSFLLDGASRPERSRVPRDVFGAAFFLLPFVGLVGRDASSSLRRASFSAFLRAASAALEAAASLYTRYQWLKAGGWFLYKRLKSETYALLLSLATLTHSADADCSAFAFATAFFCAADSAFCAFPAAFLVFSPAFFLPAIVGSASGSCRA